MRRRWGPASNGLHTKVLSTVVRLRHGLVDIEPGLEARTVASPSASATWPFHETGFRENRDDPW